MKKLIVAVVVAMLCVGCVPKVETVNLIEGADKVRVFRKSDPPASCVEIKPFSVVTGSGCGALGSIGGFEASYNLFRNNIVQMSGNAGLIQNEVPPHSQPYGNPMGGPCFVNAYLINGVAYKCPVSVLTAQ